MQRYSLSANWQLKQRDSARPILSDFESGEWIPASVPGTVQQDLLAAGRIPDPFVGLNENDVQWVGDADWLYRCTFQVSESDLQATNLDLCFDGLDTFATVWLNEERILESDNMFVPARVEVKDKLKAGANTLYLQFESAMRRGREREAQHGKLHLWNGDSSRLYVRKAQYHYGWDWGPVVMTAGAWKEIRLEVYNARIEDVHILAEVSADLGEAVLPIQVSLAGAVDGQTVHITLFNPAGQPIAEGETQVKDNAASYQIEINRPELWYPRGYGQQLRYRVVVGLMDGDQMLDSHEVKIGLRRLKLAQDTLPSEAGTSFCFEINNVPIFCGGANWIPADNLLNRISDAQYRAWLEMAAEGNMVMLRIWGGGIYEADIFYDICDELGLLVWQDFMFACGQYPALDWFQASVHAEAEAALRRLRHHASIVIWCGNNEDYALAQSIGAYDRDFTGDFTTTRFPARAIYEQLLPEVCAALDPMRPYWPGSPYGGKDAQDQTVGDRHTWEIWHGPMADYRDYPRFGSRFISEFGMQAMPDISTVEKFTEYEDRYAESKVIEHHNKATDGPKRIAWYLAGNLRATTDFEEYIYNTQFIQSEAIASAIDGWRRRWGTAGDRRTAGALVWQLNDCWPVTSWALADYYLRPKPAYYRMRRAMAPVSLGIDATEYWAVNGSLATIESVLDIQVWTLDGEHLKTEQIAVQLSPNAVTPITLPILSVPAEAVVSARLVQGETVLARAVRWPDPPKYVIYPDPGLKVTRLDDERLLVEADRPARGVVVSVREAVKWSDNMLDVIPGDPQAITATGLDGSISVRCLYHGFVEQSEN
ncbi:MAG: glycoside hydrolase family 2 protein [Anaerolineae bacterium]|nr:glycoside hydrolase family 2 protein [Anaerolineae bacterium]